MNPNHELIIIGLDLAGVETRPTGVYLLKEVKPETRLLYSDQEIINYIEDNNAHLVAIDAPLTLPPGRNSIEDRGQLHFRVCDLELKKRKIPFFPIILGPMRKLTERGIYLRHQLENKGRRVIEVYPGGAQDILGFPRAKRNPQELKKGLRRLGLKGLGKGVSVHELDAATAAYIGLLYLKGKAQIWGDKVSGAIIMPPANR